MLVKNFINNNGRSIPNQFIIHDEGRTIFQSYKTIIAIINRDGSVALDELNWDYSNTTGKYRNLFLGEDKKETLKKIKSGKYKLVNLN